MKRYLLLLLIIFGLTGTLYAAPVGLSSEADAAKSTWAYNDFTVSVGAIADFVSERGIDIPEGEFEMNVFGGRIGLNAMDRFNFYLDLGATQDMSYTCEVNTTTSKVTYDFDDVLMWGIGANALLYRWDNGLEIGVGGSYRTADLELDKATIDGVSYKKTELDSVREGEFQEWQIAAELAWRKDFIIPYVGVKYSDVEVDGDVTLATVQYNASGKNASENVGVFVGCTFLPKISALPTTEQLSINVEGRFIDEEAINVGVNYKF